ncbi:cortical protein marker for cell polarity-domain-containing protein [Mucor mucedo]|uniref:cortical protein marker for cell polarity-domain-containing protein n=1 Tax=Mucor mucedo TaxID=29922 RepID=UPI00221E8E2E|nr:cortical protein marker for cell polarity-domain-containing protein [Mucor mucedo]KAI7888659.1 cortical protein marker for cell polarity-domain-containing protein [Mucor mucedo]
MVTTLWFLLLIFVHCNDGLDVPTIKLDSLGGQLGFIGDYVGISPFKHWTQFEQSSNLNGLVISQLDDDILFFNRFATLNGTISTSCKLSDTKYILAGDFTTINSTNYNHIVEFDTQARQLSPLQQGLDGEVRSLYCDTNQVYVGGDFIAPIGANKTDYAGHVALWKDNQWSPLPWKGFNGPVYSIIRHDQQQSIVFGGNFDSTGDGQFFNQNTSQTVNLISSATISAGNSAMFGNNTDPMGVICSQSPWLLQDGMPGYWEALFNSPAKPSVFRLSNVHIDGKNTNEFNIISLGSNQYFQLSYKDPVTNLPITCSEKCILSNDSAIPYQDFTVVQEVATSGIRINIDSWYGSGGGLGSVDIFRSDVSLQPEISNSQSPAGVSDSCSTAPSSTATTTGNWTEVYSYQTYQNFLIASFPASELHSSDVSVTYQPYISGQGIYDVYITTPGCVGTSTCDQRTQIVLDITLNPGNTTTYALDQQNAADQRTLIFTGSISASSGSFQPSIVMHVSPTATTPSSNTISVVADSIEFIRNSTGLLLSSVLNYYPSNNTWLPLTQQLPAASTVTTLQSVGNQLYIGGSFRANDSYTNIVAYDFEMGYLPFNNIGLNGMVSTSLLIGSQLVLGGLFNNTEVPQQTLKNVAIYDTQTNTWSGMNEGVDARVENLYTTDNTNVHLSGPFTTADGLPTFNNAQWSLKNRQWVPSSSLIVGPVANQLQVGSDSILYLGGIKSAQTYRANDIASLETQQWKVTDVDPNATVTAGVFWKNGKTDTTILSGLFNFNNTQYHLAMYDGAWSGLLQNVQGEVSTLYVVQNQLLVGGQFKGTLDGSNSPVTSFAVYDLQKQAFQDVQGVTNSDGSPGQVNVIRPQSDGKSIFVAGNFSFAGLLNCDAICSLASDSRQWSQVSQGIEGNVMDMSIYKDSITVVGDLKVGSTMTGLAVLDNVNAASWRTAANDFTSTSSLVNDGTGNFIISGRDNNQFYLGTWNGNDLKPIDTKLGSGTNIQQLLYMPVSSSPSEDRFPADSDTLLMAVGHLEIPGFGSSSAALYDGSTWYPYALTSSANGSSGIIHSTFTITECCTPKSVRQYLSIPAVILISIAISLAILFVLIACVFLFLFLKRRNSVKSQTEPMPEWRPKHRPTSLLAMLDAANLHDSAILAAGPSSKREETAVGYTTALDGRGQSMDISDNSRLRSSSGFSGGIGGISFGALLANALKTNGSSAVASDESPKVYYAKYPFEAKEFGELAFDAKVPIVVTDTSDNVWWMGYKDDGSGNPVSGLFPSNYVSSTKPF